MPQILQIAGGGLETYSRLSEGREAKAAAENNAGIEEDNAGFAIQAGEDRAQQIIRLGDEARATTRARASASGLVADTGSPLLVQEEALYESAKDANKTRYASRVQAFGHRQRARMYRISGKNAEAASYIRDSLLFWIQPRALLAAWEQGEVAVWRVLDLAGLAEEE